LVNRTVDGYFVEPEMTLSEALRDPNLFARYFRGKTWAAWRVFLAALFAEATDAAGLELYRACTGRTAWPTKPFTEAALIVGRRGGKSRILALIAVFLACFRDYAPYLAPGEMATIAVLASDRAQARVIFRFVLGLLQAVPLIKPLIVDHDAETITLSNRVVIEIGTASFRAARGYSYAAVLCDEVAFWRSDETSANPDIEILRALRPGLANIPGSMLLIASSPYAKRGELYAVWRKHYGHDDGRVLVWKATTAEMNSSIDPAIIKEAYDSDPEAARAEYGAEFRDDLADFVIQEAVDAVTMRGRSELPPLRDITYSAFCDPSGGVSDAMTLAIGHLAGDVCVLDAVLEVRPPFDPEQAVSQCAMLLRRYGVSQVIGDRYAGEWPKARFAEHGIEFEQSARPKSDLYGDLLPLLNAGRVELLDLPRLSRELTGLERRTARSGKDSIDHTPGGHDDLANAVAGVLVGLDLDRRPPLVKIDDVTGDGAEEPSWCQYVYLMIADAGPDIAAVFCGSIQNDPDKGVREPLHILDVELVYFRPGLFGELAQRLRDMGAKWRVRAAVIFAPEHLAVQVAGLGMRVEVLPKDFKPDLQLTLASECIGAGLVRFCPPVVAKMSTRTIAAALALKAGDAVETALRSALITAIWLKHAVQRT
jgi:hypothetical protein